MTTAQLEKLSSFQFFGGFKPAELQVLVELADEFTFRESEIIIQEGAVEDCMFVLLDGKVEVRKAAGHQVHTLVTLEAGSFFGEIALVDDGPRSATVIAVSPCRVLRIARSTVSVLAGVQPGAAIHLLGAIGRSLVRLLRGSTEKYLDLLLAHRIPSSLPEKTMGEK